MSKMHYSKGADELNHDLRDSDPDNLERYYSEAGDELHVLTNEREEFEAGSSHDLRNDILNDGQWTEFIEFLGLNKAKAPATTQTQPTAAAMRALHTPTPWILRMGSNRKTPVAFIDTKTDNTVIALEAMTAEGRKDFNANAAHIVHCVNTYEQTQADVAALREALSGVHNLLTDVITRGHCAKFADATGGDMGNAITLRESLGAVLARHSGAGKPGEASRC